MHAKYQVTGFQIHVYPIMGYFMELADYTYGFF